jgi:acetyl esterase/lipase
MVALSSGLAAPSVAQVAAAELTYTSKQSVPYLESPIDEYQRERCVLDLYVPEDTAGFTTVVWFHGGALRGGERFIPEELKQQGLALVAPGYRLSPKVNSPAYVEDAAAAVAWVLNNIESYGGSPERVIVSGHSAGGYLATMVCLDKRWLAKHDIDANDLAGLVSYSGQAVTHSTIRGERSIPSTQPIVDDMAALYHVRGDAPPVVLMTGGRELELPGRYEENAYLWRMLKVNGHPDVTLHEIDGTDHGSMVAPGHEILLDFIERVLP